MAGLTVAGADAILADNFAPWVLAMGIATQSVGPEGVTLSIPFSDELCRVGGTMCGQALAAGADTAMVIALAAAMGGFKPVTTVDLSTTFMRPIADKDAVLEAKVVRLGKTLGFCTCEIHEKGGTRPAVIARATYAISS
ncbi:MAG: PaaI family thioesterase [Hyphomicrobiaceae bacterium]